MKIERVTVGELEEYQRQFAENETGELPISARRARSLARQPFTRSDDIALYVVREGEKMVAFQSLLHDRWLGRESMLWMSGVWVRPSFRRQGVAGRLMSKIIKENEGRIALANMAPARERMLHQRPDFLSAEAPTMVRCYRRFQWTHFFAHRLPFSKAVRPVLQGVDRALNFIHDPILRMSRLPSPPSPERVERIKSEDQQFLSERTSFSEKEKQMLQWKLSHPWVGSEEEDRREQLRYPFSCYAEHFSSELWRFRSRDGSVAALLWFVQRDGHVKIPLWITDNDEGLETSRWWILAELRRQSIESLTLSAQVSNFLTGQGRHFWWRRSLPAPVYVHQSLAALLGEDDMAGGYRLYCGDWGMT